MTPHIDTILNKIITQRNWPARLVVFLFASLVAGCGAGGGGGSPGNNPAVTYNGVTTQARLTDANASGYFALLWDGGSSMGGISSGARTAKTATTTGSSSQLGGLLRIVRLMVAQRPAHAPIQADVTKRVASMVSINETVQGVISGTMTLSGSIDDSNGRGSVAITCTNFNNGDGYTHNGSATMRIDSLDMTSGVPTDSTISFDRWAFTDNGAILDVVFSGSIRLAGQNSPTLTINIDGRENKAKETFRFADFTFTSGYTNTSPLQPTESMSGRVYREAFGYVEVTTTSPLIYAVSYSGSETHPSSGGPLLFTGAGGTKATVTPQSYLVMIAVDSNGDGANDTIGRFFWDTLSGAALTSLSVTPAAPSVPAGQTQQFVATGRFADQTTKDLSNLVTWATGDQIIAVISSHDISYSGCMVPGCAIAKYQGTTPVTAALGDLTANATLDVTPAVLTTVSVIQYDSSQSRRH